MMERIHSDYLIGDGVVKNSQGRAKMSKGGVESVSNMNRKKWGEL